MGRRIRGATTVSSKISLWKTRMERMPAGKSEDEVSDDNNDMLCNFVLVKILIEKHWLHFQVRLLRLWIPVQPTGYNEKIQDISSYWSISSWQLFAGWWLSNEVKTVPFELVPRDLCHQKQDVVCIKVLFSYHLVTKKQLTTKTFFTTIYLQLWLPEEGIWRSEDPAGKWLQRCKLIILNSTVGPFGKEGFLKERLTNHGCLNLMCVFLQIEKDAVEKELRALDRT